MAGKSQKFAEHQVSHVEECIRAKCLQFALIMVSVKGFGIERVGIRAGSQGQPERARNKKKMGEMWY